MTMCKHFASTSAIYLQSAKQNAHKSECATHGAASKQERAEAIHIQYALRIAT